MISYGFGIHLTDYKGGQMIFKYNNDGKGKSESHEIDISPELDARINET